MEKKKKLLLDLDFLTKVRNIIIFFGIEVTNVGLHYLEKLFG